MAHNKATLSSAIHFMGSLAGRSYFDTSLSDQDTPNLSGYIAEQKVALSKCFDVMMRYLKDANDKGVKISIGTDCRDGGKALLSELLLLHEAGFSTADILQIATLNGAQAMNLNKSYGVLEKGKIADVVIFNLDPYKDYKNFLGEQIIKSGRIFSIK